MGFKALVKTPKMGSKSGGKRLAFGKKIGGFGSKLGKGKMGKSNIEGPHK